MRAAWYEEFGAAQDVLKVGERETPTPGPGEVLVRLYRTILGRQIPHVAVAREDPVILTEVFVDGLGLGGRLNDDDVHLA